MSSFFQDKLLSPLVFVFQSVILKPLSAAPAQRQRVTFAVTTGGLCYQAQAAVPKAELSRSTFLQLSPGDVLLSGCQAGTRPQARERDKDRWEMALPSHTDWRGGGKRHHRREQGQEGACRHEALVDPIPQTFSPGV